MGLVSLLLPIHACDPMIDILISKQWRHEYYRGTSSCSNVEEEGIAQQGFQDCSVFVCQKVRSGANHQRMFFAMIPPTVCFALDIDIIHLRMVDMYIVIVRVVRRLCMGAGG